MKLYRSNASIKNDTEKSANHSLAEEIRSNDMLHAIEDAIYDLGDDEVRSLYNIHVNYINESYIVDCISVNGKVPSVKLSAYISRVEGLETLKIMPKALTNFPVSISLGNQDRCREIVNIYQSALNFVLALYDFEYDLGGIE